MTIDQVHKICVERFAPVQHRREVLFLQLTDFLIYFGSLGFKPAEVWIDGSFLTDKPEPGDIDLLIVVHMGEVAKLPRSTQDLLYSEFGEGPIRRKFECEVLVAPSTDSELIGETLRFFRNLSSRNTFKKKGLVKLVLE